MLVSGVFCSGDIAQERGLYFMNGVNVLNAGMGNGIHK